MQSKLARWSTESKERKFDRLLKLIADRAWLQEAARITLASSGAGTPGVDGVDKVAMEGNLHCELETIRTELLAGCYTPLPARRVYIPKANGKLRPLGIPSLRDRIVQRAMLMVMEPIWESDFHRMSYGFRPARSVHHAMQYGRSNCSCRQTMKEVQPVAGLLRATWPATSIRFITDCCCEASVNVLPISASLPCCGSLSRRAMLIEVCFAPRVKVFRKGV